HLAGAEPAPAGVDGRAAATVTGDRFERQSEHAGNALVRVMRLRRREDRLAWMQLPGDPQRLEVCHRTAAAQMTEVRVPADHPGQISDRFLLNRRAAAV